MAENTFVELGKQTLVANAATVVFNSIPSTYTNLKIVINAKAVTGTPSIYMQYNGDTTSTNYSFTGVYGLSASRGSARGTNINWVTAFQNGVSANNFNSGVIYIMNYASTNRFKTNLARWGGSDYEVDIIAGRWNQTSAINQITLISQSNLLAGSTFTLYGIKSKPVSGTAKATGGTISYDTQGNTYHTFTSSGTFTPTQALDCEILLIAGGGSGGNNKGGGGGAGGFLSGIANLGVSGYTVTVGAGGSNKANGTNSTFNSLIAIGGGTGGTYDGTDSVGRNGARGGSGGGGSSGDVNPGGSWGPGTTGQGNRGGSGVYSTSGVNTNDAGGGGGAGAVGANGATGQAGAGGSGLNTFSSWATATSTGASGYYAGGGGGGSWGNAPGAGGAGGGGAGDSGTSPVSGTANTGGGGGGVGQASATGGAGGSGIVIIRY